MFRNTPRVGCATYCALFVAQLVAQRPHGVGILGGWEGAFKARSVTRLTLEKINRGAAELIGKQVQIDCREATFNVRDMPVIYGRWLTGKRPLRHGMPAKLLSLTGFLASSR